MSHTFYESPEGGPLQVSVDVTTDFCWFFQHGEKEEDDLKGEVRMPREELWGLHRALSGYLEYLETEYSGEPNEVVWDEQMSSVRRLALMSQFAGILERIELGRLKVIQVALVPLDPGEVVWRTLCGTFTLTAWVEGGAWHHLRRIRFEQTVIERPGLVALGLATYRPDPAVAVARYRLSARMHG